MTVIEAWGWFLDLQWWQGFITAAVVVWVLK
jgi:hypothetical protein